MLMMLLFGHRTWNDVRVNDVAVSVEKARCRRTGRTPDNPYLGNVRRLFSQRKKNQPDPSYEASLGTYIHVSRQELMLIGFIDPWSGIRTRIDSAVVLIVCVMWFFFSNTLQGRAARYRLLREKPGKVILGLQNTRSCVRTKILGEVDRSV